MAEGPDQEFPTEADVDAVLHEFNGSGREAISALLHDIAVLATDFEARASKGYVRGDFPRLLIRRSR